MKKQYVLPFPPTFNTYWRSWRGRIRISDEGRAWKERAELVAISQSAGAPLKGPVAVKVALYFPNRRGDLDNRLKVLLDVLEGLAYSNDSQIDELLAVRRIDKAHPRAEVCVMPIS